MITAADHPDLEGRLVELSQAGRLELGTPPSAALACLQLPSRSGLWRMPVTLPPADQIDMAISQLVSAGLVAFEAPSGAPRHVTAALRRPGDGDGHLPAPDALGVAVFGDLALILALQASPTWVAEVHDPSGASPDVLLYGGAEPPAVLEERRQPTGDPAFALLNPDAAVRELAARCWSAGETHIRITRPAGQQVTVKAVAIRRQDSGVEWIDDPRTEIKMPSASHLEEAVRALLALSGEAA